jgi:predicted transporter
MFNVFGHLDWLAIALATLACTALGGLWFAALFPRQYALALGRDPAHKLPMTPLMAVGPMLCMGAVAVTCALLMEALHVTALGDALAFGAIVGIGFLVATMVNIAINPNFPRPLAYAALNAPYFLASGLVICSVLVAFRH